MRSISVRFQPNYHNYDDSHDIDIAINILNTKHYNMPFADATVSDIQTSSVNV